MHYSFNITIRLQFDNGLIKVLKNVEKKVLSDVVINIFDASNIRAKGLHFEIFS